VQEARKKVLDDASTAGLLVDGHSLDDGGIGADAYADAISTYLGMAISKLANRCSNICFWDTIGENVQQVFARQAIPMTWDYIEGNPFSDSTGNFIGQLHYTTHVVESSFCGIAGEAKQRDATSVINGIEAPLVSTDPPYYDNIGYAVM